MSTRDTRVSATRLDEVLRQIDGWIGPQGVSGAAAVVWRGGEIAAERFAGEARPGVPVDGRTMFALASVTKPITAAVAMTLLEEGLLALDEPVYRFVPEFAPASDAPNADPNLEARRREVTIRQLLAHTSGLPEDLAPGTLRYRDRPDLTTITDAMTRLPLRTVPGTELLYSNAGFALLGRLVERVSGGDFWAEARRRVFNPLELHDIVARPDAEDEPRLALVADTNLTGTDVETYNSAYWRGLAMPWGGLFGTARDLARFAGAFLPHGPQLFAPPTVALMTSDQARGVSGGVQSMRVVWHPAYWGLGWEVKGDKRRHWTGELTSPRTFCHFGAAGTLLWADPALDVALAVFANRTTTHLWPFVPAARWSRLSNAIIAAL
ncbi:MAG: beta-lactamase class [Thermomicrobiales bacterium]|nr:beta-lactamase class [Thermomicrobiales bacterium]